MGSKVFLAVAFAAGFAASAALAAGPPPGKGNDGRTTTTPGTSTPAPAPPRHEKRKRSAERRALGCEPTTSLVLTGNVVGSPRSSEFTVLVVRSNKHARELNRKRVTIEVLASTKIRRMGQAELSDLRARDWVLVQARACRVSATSRLKLLATTVVAHPPVAAAAAPPTRTTTAP